MKVIFVAVALFAVAYAFPGEQDAGQKSNIPVSKSESDSSKSKALNEPGWEEKLKHVFNDAKNYLGSKFGNQGKEESHGKSESDNEKPTENKGTEASYSKDENNKGKEGPSGKDEHDYKKN